MNARKRFNRQFWCRNLLRSLTVLTLTLAGALLAFPVLWLAASSFKTNAEIFTPLQLLPTRLSPTYYLELLSGAWLPYTAQYASTLLLVGAQTLLVLAVSSAAGFVLALYRFPLRTPLYLLALSVIFVPKETLIVPMLEWLLTLGLTDSYLGVILPGSVSGLAVLFFTETTRRLPRELFDQARVEGASEWGVYLHVALPLLRPALLTYAFIHALLAWHEVLFPLIILSSPEKLPVSVGLGSLFGSLQRVPYGVIMAGFTLMTLPAVAAYLLVRRQLVSVLSTFVGE